MPNNLIEIIGNTNRKSNCHNCSRIIEGGETKVKINYPHPTGFRYYYLCKDCAIKMLIELQRRILWTKTKSKLNGEKKNDKN